METQLLSSINYLRKHKGNSSAGSVEGSNSTRLASSRDGSMSEKKIARRRRRLLSSVLIKEPVINDAVIQKNITKRVCDDDTRSQCPIDLVCKVQSSWVCSNNGTLAEVAKAAY